MNASMQSNFTDHLTWRVIVSNALTFIGAYDETDPIKQQQNGDRQWAKTQLEKIANTANKIAANLDRESLPVCPAPTVSTVYCAARLQEIVPTFSNVLIAGTTKTESNYENVTV